MTTTQEQTASKDCEELAQRYNLGLGISPSLGSSHWEYAEKAFIENSEKKDGDTMEVCITYMHNYDNCKICDFNQKPYLLHYFYLVYNKCDNYYEQNSEYRSSENPMIFTYPIN
jgi:hypothetical protein